LDVDAEAVSEAPVMPVAFVKPVEIANRQSPIANPTGWPFDAAEAKKRQTNAGAAPELKIDLGGGVTLELVLIPAGEFVMGDADEAPVRRVRIEKPFYMAKFETTNQQFGLFDQEHDSGYISVFNKDQSNRGEAANRERQPVIRVSWEQAMAFCDSLSRKTGRKFTLPTEAEWEYACRAGTATPMNYGEVSADFMKSANLADQRVLNLCRADSPKWIPCVSNVNDGAVVTDNVGRYASNAWGVFDMHGNAAEWTASDYGNGKKVVRGGSFYDRPQRARSAYRLGYQSWQHVFNVGFRVTCDVGDGKQSVITIAEK
jgi:formylglycine-generating enzyme required for sulfatase activity